MSTLLLSDYDQTLYFRTDAQGTAEALSMLRRLKSEYDLCIGIVTGNSRKKLQRTAGEHFDLFAFIADFNAGGVWFSDDALHAPTIDAPMLDPTHYRDILQTQNLPPEMLNDWKQCADITFDSGELMETMFEQFSRHYAVFKEGGNKLALYPPRTNKVNIFEKLPLIEKRLGQRFSKILFLGDQIYPEGNDLSISMNPRVTARWLIRSPEHCRNVLGKVMPFHLRPRRAGRDDAAFHLRSFLDLLKTRPGTDRVVDMEAAFRAYRQMKPLMHASNDSSSLRTWIRDRLHTQIHRYEQIICTADGEGMTRSDRPHRKREFRVDGSRLVLKMRNHETDHIDLVSMLCASRMESMGDPAFPSVVLHASLHCHGYEGIARFAADIHRQAPAHIRSLHVVYTSKKLSHNMTGTTAVDTPILRESGGCKQAKFVQVKEGKYLLSITFPFGEEGYHLTRFLLALFRGTIRSVNVVGKAGGLIGERGDVVLATGFVDPFPEGGGETQLSNPTAYDLKLFHAHKTIGNHAANIHLGSVACVKGVLVQNAPFFQALQQEGVVAAEMEGFHIARAAVEAGVDLRCGYYLSDLPLRGETLNSELNTVSYDDLVSSMMLIFGVFLSGIAASDPKLEQPATLQEQAQLELLA